MSEVTLIILNWNTFDLVEACLWSIRRTTAGLDLEVMVVDNGSTDGSAERIERQYPDVRVVKNGRNLGFAAGNNRGVELSDSPFVLLLNSDAQLEVGSLQAILDLAKRNPRAGLVGARLVYPDGSFQAAYTPFPNLIQEMLILTGLGRLFYGAWYPSRGSQITREQMVAGYVEGACMLVRREAYLQAGGLDANYFMYAEDVELCYRMREEGWQVWYQPISRVIHLGGGSSRSRKPQREADLYRSRVQFFRRHYGKVSADLLKGLIFLSTAAKWCGHGVVRGISKGKMGRRVVSPGYLAGVLRGV